MKAIRRIIAGYVLSSALTWSLLAWWWSAFDGDLQAWHDYVRTVTQHMMS